MRPPPRITFGMIVLNGEPFVRYALRALYPFAHEIIVVEGAVADAAGIATPNGHSKDSTLQTLRDFKAHEDPEDKLIIVTRDGITRDGFWSEKDEMSQAYAERATGDYLWQIDSDEFYQSEDMQAVIDMLRDDPEITLVSFEMLTFWGALDFITDGWYLRRQQGKPLFGQWMTGKGYYFRVFKWGTGYQYVTHRPPTVHDAQGRDLRRRKWVRGHTLAQRGIVMYHYSLLFPKQVIEKTEYYVNARWISSLGDRRTRTWAEESYFTLKNPFRPFNIVTHPSWLERYTGTHPPQVQAMWDDAQNGVLAVALRQTEDIEALLESPAYRRKRRLLKSLYYVHRPVHAFRRFLRIRWYITRPLRRILAQLRSRLTNQSPRKA